MLVQAGERTPSTFPAPPHLAHISSTARHLTSHHLCGSSYCVPSSGLATMLMAVMWAWNLQGRWTVHGMPGPGSAGKE